MGQAGAEGGPLSVEGSARAELVVGSAGDILKVPIRKLRSRKNEGLRKFIVPLYEKPVLKFIAWSEPYAPLATLIFGYPFGLDAQGKANHGTTGFTVEQQAQLRELWEELREDILKAQAQYAPDRKPWGMRFDKKRERKMPERSEKNG
jgi:hypothetical protein